MENNDVKTMIINSFREKKSSHAFLFVTNNINNCLKDVTDIIRIVNCKETGKEDCNCNICKTINSQNNPDVITITPDGKEIKKDQILNLIDQFNTKPLINTYSSYIICECDKLNISSANKILKFLEEPEGDIVGFFITDNLQGVLPTIRSRCSIYQYRFNSENILDLLDINEESYSVFFDYTLNLLDKLNDSPKYVLMTESKNIAKKERSEIEMILHLLKKFYVIKYEDLMTKKYSDVEYAKRIIDTIMTKDIKIIVKRIKIIDNILNDFKVNVNKELIINKLFICWE